MALFKNTPSYEGGNSNTYVKTAYLMTAIVTEQVNSATGSHLSIYDRDITTYYELGPDGSSDLWIKWTFEERKKFKNLYFYAFMHNDSGASIDVVYLQGSNDDTNWTNLDSFNVGVAATVTKPLLASEVNYRYIRVLFDVVSGTAGSRLYMGEGVI